MAVTYEIKNFETVGSNKLVGFTVTHNTGKVLVIDIVLFFWILPDPLQSLQGKECFAQFHDILGMFAVV